MEARGTEARRHAVIPSGKGARKGNAVEVREGAAGGVSAVWRRAMRGEKWCEVDETRACGAVRVDARVGIVGKVRRRRRHECERCVMGNRQDGMWTGRTGEIFGVRREEIGAVVLGDGRRGVEAHCWVCGCEEMGREQSAHRLNWEGRKPISSRIS